MTNNTPSPPKQTRSGMENSMLTYHNDKKFKRDMIREMEKHRKADAFIKGSYGKENGSFKGCAVGCAVHSLKTLGKNGMNFNDHASLSSALGWGEWLERLHDLFFENLPEPENSNFAVDLLKAVPVGKDISRVEFRFKKFLLEENLKWVEAIKNDAPYKKKVLNAINRVMAVVDYAIKTGKVDESARYSAWCNAWSVARSYICSTTKSIAESADLVTKSIAESAAWSAWSAESAARSAAHKRYAKKLISLLKDV